MAHVLATLAYGIKGLRRDTSWDWPYFHNDPQQENASQMERWSLNQAPTWTVPPLAIANRHYDTNNQLVQNTRYRLILTKASNLDWLTRDKHAMRDLSTVAQEGSHHWVPMQDLAFNEVILFGYAADHSSRALRSLSCAQRQGVAAIRTQSRGKASSRHLLFRWMASPTLHEDPNGPTSKRETHPQRLATATTTETSQTPHEKARDILARMDPAPDGQQFEPTST